MEIKRRKFDSSLSTKDQTAINNVLNAKKLLDAIEMRDLDKALYEITKLKKFLTTKERVYTFVQSNKQCLNAVVTFLLQPISNESDNSVPSQSVTLVREAFSLLANACHLSVLACFEMRKKNTSLSRLYVQLLEANHSLVPFPLKATIIRLLGNLCELKEIATVVATNSALLDRIVLLLDFNHQQVADQALRVLRLLAKRKNLSKYVILSNSCYHIAKYIVNNKHLVFENRPDILQTLNFLLKYHPSSTGRQLSNCSEFMDICLNHLLTFPTHEADKLTPLTKYWLDFILHATEFSTDICTVFGQANAIGKILDLEQSYDQLSDIYCRFLSSFTKHTFYRTHLHENGSLFRILDRLEPAEYDSQTTTDKRLSHLRIQCSILEHLRFFLYENSLIDAIKHPSFMRITLHHVCRFLDEKTPKCQIQYTGPNGIYGEPIYNLQFDQKTEDEQISANPDGQHALLCKDYSTYSVYNFSSLSPSSSVLTLSPPSMSPSTSTGRISPTQGALSPSASPPQFPTANAISASNYSSNSFFLDDFLLDAGELRKETMSPIIDNATAPEELEPDDATEIIRLDNHSNYNSMEKHQRLEDYEEQETELRQKIVQCTLMLIAHYSHSEESQSIFLLKHEIIDMLVRYISDAPELDNRLIRALRRLARHQSGLQLLLEMDFYQIVLFRLINSECKLARYARPCARCDIRHDIGRMLLSDFSLIADSPMGEHILLKLRMDSAEQKSNPQEIDFIKIKALMAALILIRKDSARRSRLYHIHRPIHNLLDAIGKFMRQSKKNEKQLDEFGTEGILCCEVLAILGLFLSQRLDSNILKSIPIYYSRITREQEQQSEQVKNKNNCILENMIQVEKVVQNHNNEFGQKLKFYNNLGRLLVEVPKQELCASNEYFSGMFGSEFMERLQSRNEFTFDENAENLCSEENFIKFLHFSIGCSFHSECVRVENAECCTALLYLADKYLCTRLLDHLLAGGVAARFINGQSLKLFLPLVLSVPTIETGLKDICMLVLLRYSNNSELLSTFRHIVKCDSGSGTIIGAFVSLIQEFLAPYTAENL